METKPKRKILRTIWDGFKFLMRELGFATLGAFALMIFWPVLLGICIWGMIKEGW